MFELNGEDNHCGAGVAGLAAAEILAREGISVIVLEARDRAGGRSHTVSSRTGNLIVELGAEFVHGAKNAVWDVLHRAGFKPQQIVDRHWDFSNGVYQSTKKFGLVGSLAPPGMLLAEFGIDDHSHWPRVRQVYHHICAELASLNWATQVLAHASCELLVERNCDFGSC